MRANAVGAAEGRRAGSTLHQHRDVPTHLIRIGQRVQTGWHTAAERTGLCIDVGGIAPLSHFAFTGPRLQEMHTLFTQMMLERGFLASKGFYVTYAHQDEHIERYLVAVEEVFGLLVHALEHNTIQHLLKGPVAHTGFHRLT